MVIDKYWREDTDDLIQQAALNYNTSYNTILDRVYKETACHAGCSLEGSYKYRIGMMLHNNAPLSQIENFELIDFIAESQYLTEAYIKAVNNIYEESLRQEGRQDNI